MRSGFLIAVLMCVVVGCYFSSSAAMQRVCPEFSILTPDRLRGLERLFGDADGFWLPTTQQVQQVGVQLDLHLAELLAKSHLPATTSLKQVIDTFAEGRWQVVGLLRSGGRSIYISRLPPAGSAHRDGVDVIDWLEDYVSVEDGGSEYWNIEYYCEKGVFSMIEFGGES